MCNTTKSREDTSGCDETPGDQQLHASISCYSVIPQLPPQSGTTLSSPHIQQSLRSHSKRHILAHLHPGHIWKHSNKQGGSSFPPTPRHTTPLVSF
ncbi:hypothetical protein E2C01_003897 [Portunus trituberculatus]|uniref:Uncharacterized protein n=1 Tax=Portunus trituberculatus TaxID=210409 RepID=A0A5B7CPV8_PORTR|nr:hypothetical protein [Portunus trituberculatus]